ncbi:MAG: hypothetical protein JXB04_10885 [Kiritimatiellae bacterium]|nr:hypothetical protein [Kiritimatiellia bacterium]
MNQRVVLVSDLSDVLAEVVVDTFHFRVTPNPWKQGACVVWFRRADASPVFEALGQFSHFDKRKVLEFVTRYSTNRALRQEIEKRKFLKRIENLSPAYLERLERLKAWQKQAAYRTLFSLDSVIEQPPLDAKRRIMARRFHPDAGGDNRYMTLINEAFEHLAPRTCR